MAILVQDDRVVIQLHDASVSTQLLALESGKQIVVTGWSLTVIGAPALIRLRFHNSGATVSKYIAGFYPYDVVGVGLGRPWVYNGCRFVGPKDYALGFTSTVGTGAILEGHVEYTFVTPSP